MLDMPLEDLLKTIETLQARIRDHGVLLSQNEIRTRYALVDPLLRVLGWDVGNPSEVVPEQDASGGRADYALLDGNGKPAVIIEAKRLDRSLTDGLHQSIAYCVGEGTPFFGVTDGRRWAIYETFRQVAVNEKLVTEVDILGDSPAGASLKALELWRPNVVGRHSVVKRPVEVPAAQADSESSWIRLSELRVETRTKPEWLQPPSGVQVSTPSWTMLAAHLAQWLVDVGRLSEATAPIQVGNRYVLAPEPTHPDGKPFKRVKRAGPLFIETNYSGADTVRNARLLVERAEMQPSDFRVRLANRG